MTTPTPTSTTGPGPAEPAPAEEKGPVALVARLFLTQLLAVAAIAAIIATIFTAAGRGTGPDPTTAAKQSASQTASAHPSPNTTSTTKPAVPPAQATTSAPPSTSASSPAADLPKVDVLNQSAGNGVAGTTADQLRAAGWRIGRVDDFRGNVSTTTIYFPPGLRTQARALARALPGSQRILPAFSTISSNRLSIILVR